MPVTKILIPGLVDGAAQGTPVFLKVTDNLDGTLSLDTTASLVLDASDIAIGAVEIKDASADTRAKVGAVSGLVVGDNGIPTAAKLIGSERVTGISAVTGSGASPVAAGKKSVAFIFSSNFTGTIKTVAIDAAQISTLGFEAPPGDTLDSITYTVTAGTLTILTVT